MKTEVEFIYEKELKNDGIIEHAHIIAEASQQISEIAESRKRLRELKETIERHSKYIQDGKISFQTVGEFEWHKPIVDYVTIHSIQGDFPEFIRPMTPKEIEEYCELEIPFEAEDSIVVHSKEEAERAKDRLKAVGWNVTDEELDARVTIVELPEKQESEQRDETEQEEDEVPQGYGDDVDVFKSAKNRRYFLLDDVGERVYLTMQRMSQSQLYFQDPAVSKGTILKNRKDIPLVDQSEKGQEEATQEAEDYNPNNINVYKSAENGRYFILNDVEERVYLAVVSADAPMSNLIVFIHPIAATGYLRKLKDQIILVDQKHKEEQPHENLLNSTENYDVIENVDGSINARIKHEKKEMINEH